MLIEAIPRLVVHLRSMLPDAKIEILIGEHAAIRASEPRPNPVPLRMSMCMRNQPDWLVISEMLPLSPSTRKSAFVAADQTSNHLESGIQYLDSSLLLKFRELEQISGDSFLKLLTFENLGLRGLTLIEGNLARDIIVRTGFVAQVGRTLDETENLAIDFLSLLRFAKILKDRISRSSVDGKFSYEMYHSQYLAAGRGRNRYINYARSIFQGSTERVFGQMQSLLKKDFGADCSLSSPGLARIYIAQLRDRDRKIEFSLRVPGEIPGEVPMVTCDSPIMIHRASAGAVGMAVLPAHEMMELAARLNRHPETRTLPGHFEITGAGAFLTYVTWKHLTNEIHLFSLDYIVTGIARAEEILSEELTRLSHSIDLKSNSVNQKDAQQFTTSPALKRRVA